MNGIFVFSSALPNSLLILAGKATLLLTLVFIIRLMMRTASASSRYFLIGTGMIMIGCLPVLALIAPDWNVPVPEVIQSRITSNAVPSPLPEISSAGPRIESLKGTAGAAETKARRPASRGNALLYLWLLGTAAAVGRVLMGMAGCARSRRRPEEPDSNGIHNLVEKASRRIGLRKEIAIRLGDRTETPYISGVVRPVLNLPRHVLCWPEQRLMSVLLHELAHIKRGDHVLWPLVNLAVSWLWFNPLAWIALAFMKKERERACDDYVLACGSSRTSYAQHLLEACLSLGSSVRAAPLSLQFARRNEVRDRILYLLDQRMNHRPMSRAGQIALVLLLAVAIVPLTGITGFSTAVTSNEVSPGEREAVIATLEAFYAELSDGSDFQTVREKFLTADYFDDPRLTLEKLDRAVWQPVFNNTVCCIAEGRARAVDEVRSRITSLRRDGEEIIAELQMEITGYCLDKKQTNPDTDSAAAGASDKTAGTKAAIRQCHVVNSYSQPIRFRHEKGAWKISLFSDGVALMQMDTDNPYGPIFLVWIEDIDARTTPFGARVFKVIPRDIVPDAHNAQFSLEE